jgi:heptosyltransferase-2
MTGAISDNILVIGPTWVGDMVMAQSLFICLKQQYPTGRITVMAPDWTRPLLDRMPEVDGSIDSRLAHGDLKLGARRAIGKSLQSQEFSQAIVLPNSFKSALIPFHAGIPVRTGWQGEFRNLLLTDCRRLNEANYPLMVQRLAALAYPASDQPPVNVPNPAISIDPDMLASTLKEFRLQPGPGILAICPGAEFGEAKQWPSEHYATVCNSVIEQGWRVWIFGSSNDQLAAHAILADLASSNFESCTDMTGRTSLAQAIDLLSLADAVVSNDSGLMHIGAALQKPIVGIFGSTSPDFTPPLAERVKLLATDIECRPCFKRQCPYGHLRCLTELEPSIVIDALDQIVNYES